MSSIAVMIPTGGFSGSLLPLLRRLKEHGVEPVVIAQQPGRWRGDGGVEVTATHGLGQVDVSRVGAILCVDGEGERLANNREAIELLRTAHKAGMVIAGIGNGSLVLAQAGLLHRCAVAADEGLAERLRAHGAGPTLAPVETCGRIVTAIDAAATELADEVVEFRLDEHEVRP